MPSWLPRLVETAKERVEQGYYDARPRAPLEPIGSLRASIERAFPALVAEIKPGRPGGPARSVDVKRIARAYSEGGACAISVLTEADHFGGSLENLERARVAGLPLLMKDFVVDEAQVEAARAWGASAVLAIVRLHTEGHTAWPLADLTRAAHARGIEVLAEAVTERELDLALDLGADVVGINTRDLDSLAVDAGRTGKLLAARKLAVPALHLSGVGSRADVQAALKAGASGVLVGSVLMDAPDPAATLRALVEAPR